MARPCLANRFLCWAAKIEKLGRPGNTMTFTAVCACAAPTVPIIAAPASAAMVELLHATIATPPGLPSVDPGPKATTTGAVSVQHQLVSRPAPQCRAAPAP